MPGRFSAPRVAEEPYGTIFSLFLSRPEQSINDATHALKASAIAHVGEIRQVIADDPLTVWRSRAVFVLGMLAAMCLGLVVAFGASAWWLGLQTSEIKRQRAVIAQLESLGGKVDLKTCQGEPLRLCVAVATDENARFKTGGGQTYMVLEGY